MVLLPASLGLVLRALAGSPIHDIIANVDPPSYGSTGQFYCFDCDEMNCVKKFM